MVSEAGKLSEACTNGLSSISKECIEPLEWFKPLTERYSMGKEEIEQHDVTMQLGRALHPGLTDEEVSLMLLQCLPHFDRCLCLASLGAESMPEYELEICSNLIRMNRAMSLATFKAEVGMWRQSGLYHVLMLAAGHMPDVASWVGKKHLGEASAKGLESALGSLSKGSGGCKRYADSLEIMGKFVAAQDTRQASGHRIAAVLDRLAVYMGVRCARCCVWFVFVYCLTTNDAKMCRSNARVAKHHELGVSLAWFSSFVGEKRNDPVAMWAGIRQALRMPPCVLSCPSSSGKSDALW